MTRMQVAAQMLQTQIILQSVCHWYVMRLICLFSKNRNDDKGIKERWECKGKTKGPLVGMQLFYHYHYFYFYHHNHGYQDYNSYHDADSHNHGFIYWTVSNDYEGNDCNN